MAQEKRRQVRVADRLTGDAPPQIVQTPLPSVERFIQTAIANCGKTQKRIAEEVGFSSPNIIAMIKYGTTRLPFDKIAPIAKALNVNPAYLLDVAIANYYPETWRSVRVSREPLSEFELKVVHALRKANVAPAGQDAEALIGELLNRAKKPTDSDS